jgi:predicted phage terminase large subunit-like protein
MADKPPVELSELSVGPQKGPQERFLASQADIAIYGGAAGGGKTFALMLEPLRHFHNPLFGCVIFRRNTVQIRNEGGLWDTSEELYYPLGATSNQAYLQWTFPYGMQVKFAHLEREATVYDWHGAQIPLIGFDELTTFTEKQFWYMLSRNRSTSGVKPYIRATCNPDPDSFVRKLIDWWIDNDSGYAIPERSGKIRWFLRVKDDLVWGNSRDEILKRYGHGSSIQPKSLTFIPSKLSDNKILMQKDPAYEANLLNLGEVDRKRLLEGNWNVRPQAGNFFRREWFEIVPVIRGGWKAQVRFWDRAATRVTPQSPDPDWTRGLKIAAYPDGTFLIVDLVSTRDTPAEVNKLIKNVATQDGYGCLQMAQQDPGSAGKLEVEDFYKLLAGHQVKSQPFFRDKETRAKAVSAACQVGNIKVLKGKWNDEFFNEVENFPPPKDSGHDDIVDCLSGGYNELTGSPILDPAAVAAMSRILGGANVQSKNHLSPGR